MPNFLPARSKLTIGSLETGSQDLFVRAQYNPKELQIDKPVLWVDHPELAPEYKGRAPRTMTLELLFDGYEDRTFDVQDQVNKLDQLASPREPDAPSEAHRRPHRCVVVWGERGIPALRCVIEAMTAKYTMFDDGGEPLRATCTVKVREIDIRTMYSEDRHRDEDAAKHQQRLARMR